MSSNKPISVAGGPPAEDRRMAVKRAEAEAAAAHAPERQREAELARAFAKAGAQVTVTSDFDTYDPGQKRRKFRIVFAEDFDNAKLAAALEKMGLKPEDAKKAHLKRTSYNISIPLAELQTVLARHGNGEITGDNALTDTLSTGLQGDDHFPSPDLQFIKVRTKKDGKNCVIENVQHGDLRTVGKFLGKEQLPAIGQGEKFIEMAEALVDILLAPPKENLLIPKPVDPSVAPTKIRR